MVSETNAEDKLEGKEGNTIHTVRTVCDSVALGVNFIAINDLGS